MREAKDELDPPFEIIEPAEWRGPVVFNSPHSGSVYPHAFLSTSRLDVATLRRSEDSFVDELVLGVVAAGHDTENEFVDKRILGAAQRRDVKARGGEEGMGVDAAAVG